MFETLLNAVRKGDLARIEQFIKEEDVTDLTKDEGRELFKEAVVATNYEIIQALINENLFESRRSPLEYLEPLKGRTIFGYAVFEKFDEGVLTLLASKGYDMLSYEECADFVSNLVESYNPADLTSFDMYLNRLKVIVSLSHRTAVQKTLRNCLYNEPRIRQVINSVEWLKNHFKYGYGVVSFNKVNKIYMEMEEGKWSDAAITILSLDDDGVNRKFFETFPADENVPAWTLLSYAVSKGNIEIVNLLISKGADVNKHSERLREGRLVKFTPFELAVEMNCLECCQILSQNGAQLYLQSSNPIGNILENAILHENIVLVKLILTHRRYSSLEIEKCLDEVVGKIRDANILTQITECLKIYKLFGRTETTSMITAMLLIQNGKEQEVLDYIQELSLVDLTEEVYPNARWNFGLNACFCNSCFVDGNPGLISLLTCAVKENKLKVVETLLERGCNVYGLHGESMFGSVECKNPFKNPLLLATEENNYGMCKLLLKWGAQVNGGNMCRNAIFRGAFEQKNQKILKLLVQRLHDPCSVFDLFAQIVGSLVDGKVVIETFSVELLSFVLHKSRVSFLLWLNLVRIRPQHTIIGDYIGRHFLLNLLLNYLPTAPEEMQTALQVLSKSRAETKITHKATDWLIKNAVKCPSLQSLCRFTIRQAVQPCTESNIQSLQLPGLIQEYLLEHPLSKVLSHFQNDELRGKAKRFYLYIHH